MDTEKILEKVEKLIDMYKQGKIGGENGTIRSRKFNTFIWRQIII